MIVQLIYNSIAFIIFTIIVIIAIFPTSLSRLISKMLPGDFGVDHSFSSSADDDRINEQIVSQKAILEGIFKG